MTRSTLVAGINLLNADRCASCSIKFNNDVDLQVFPSNTSNYVLVLDGTLRIDYTDGVKAAYTNSYTSEWTSYKDEWRHDVTWINYGSGNAIVLRIGLHPEYCTTSNTSLKVMCLSSGSVTVPISLNKALLVAGGDFIQNGEQVSSPYKIVSVRDWDSTGNSYTISTHTSPLTLMYLEKTDD